MREEESDLGLPAAKKSRVGEVYRRERRAFWWACGWAGVGALAYGSQLLLNLWINHQVSKMPGGFDPEAYGNLIVSVLPIMGIISITLLISLIALLICLIRWLLAIRRRRKRFEGSFPNR